MKTQLLSLYAAALGFIFTTCSTLFAQTPKGEIFGSAVTHTTESAKAVVAGASVALPSNLTGGTTYFGAFTDLPATRGRAPVVVFLHGSTGIKLPAIAQWQQWLATQGIASIAPDSFGLPDRLTYKSPVSKDVYEKIHALRSSEIDIALAALQSTSWANTSQLILAGTSEGAPAVARHGGDGFLGKMIFAWACEDNYFVESHKTNAGKDLPILNIISANDPFFSPTNSWLGNSAAKGHCAAALKTNTRVSVVLLPDAPHTLFHLPVARQMVAGFLKDVLPR